MRDSIIRSLKVAVEINNPIVIRYCDTEGEITLRKIQPIELIKNESLIAFCFLREHFRQFRVGGIIELYVRD